MKNTPSNSVSGVTSPSSRPTRLSPLVAGIAATVMSMTAASSAQADNNRNNVNIGVGNTIRVGGGVDGKARAAAKAAADSAKLSLERLEAAERGVADAKAKAAAAEASAKDAQGRLTTAEGRLADLEKKFSELPKAATESAKVDAQPRLPTAEEIAAAKAIIEARAQVAKAAAEAARAEAVAKAARVAVLQAEAERAKAAAEAAKAEAVAKATALALAQAEADAANRRATGLDDSSKEADKRLAQAQEEADEANKKLAAADAEAARAKALLDAYGTLRLQSVVVRDESSIPSFYGEAAGTLGVLSGKQFDSHGGASVGAFGRFSEHAALGVRTNLEAGSRSINVGGQTVAGSSTVITAQGAVQIGAVQGSGFNFEGAAGMQRESMNGVATGIDGAKLEGVSKTYGRVDLGANYYAQISEAFRLRVGAAMTFLVGRPVEMGSEAKETAVGGTVSIGVSTK